MLPSLSANRKVAAKTDGRWTLPQLVQTLPLDMGWADLTKPPISAYGDDVVNGRHQ